MTTTVTHERELRECDWANRHFTDMTEIPRELHLFTDYRFVCSQCNELCEVTYYTDDDGHDCDDIVCPKCGLIDTPGQAVIRPTVLPWISIASYVEVDRVYGGPEEGGWYYSAYDRMDPTLRAYQLMHYKEANEYYAYLQADMLELQGLDLRGYVKISYERIAPKNMPESKPAYS